MVARKLELCFTEVLRQLEGWVVMWCWCVHIFWQLRRILKSLVFAVSFGRTASTSNLHPLVWDCHLDCLESCGGCGMWVEQELPEMREVADTWLSTKLKDKQHTGTGCRICMSMKYPHSVPWPSIRHVVLLFAWPIMTIRIFDCVDIEMPNGCMEDCRIIYSPYNMLQVLGRFPKHDWLWWKILFWSSLRRPDLKERAATWQFWKVAQNEAHFWGWFLGFFFTEILLFLLFLGAGRTPLSIFDDRWNQCIKNDMPWVVSGRSHRSDLAAAWIFFGRSAWEVTSTNMAMRRYPDIGKVGDSSAAENLNLQLTWACI